jgi:hypothetical protein
VQRCALGDEVVRICIAKTWRRAPRRQAHATWRANGVICENLRRIRRREVSMTGRHALVLLGLAAALLLGVLIGRQAEALRDARNAAGVVAARDGEPEKIARMQRESAGARTRAAAARSNAAPTPLPQPGTPLK